MSSFVSFFPATLLVLSLTASAPADSSRPANGCYKVVYDAKHLRTHKGRFVRKVTLKIEALRPAQLRSGHGDVVGNADLGIWVKGHRQAFLSYGACREKDGGRDCTGHDLANEHRNCERTTPGVHRCRTPRGTTGKFRLETRTEGVLVTIADVFQLSASETGPYLRLVASDRDNSMFLLSPDPSCR